MIPSLQFPIPIYSPSLPAQNIVPILVSCETPFITLFRTIPWSFDSSAPSLRSILPPEWLCIDKPGRVERTLHKADRPSTLFSCQHVGKISSASLTLVRQTTGTRLLRQIMHAMPIRVDFTDLPVADDRLLA